jgi:site-specific recombinase XerD
VADFHALRHSFISALVVGGIHPKTAQRLARHSTIGLTMDRYTHMQNSGLASALNVLPDLSSSARPAVPHRRRWP